MFNKLKSNPDVVAKRDTPSIPELPRLGPQETSLALQPPVEGRSKPGSIAALPSADKPSIVSEGFTITGELRSNGVLHVEGKVSGTLVAHSINISATGEVKGEVTCTTLNIKGHLKGSVVCDEVVVASSAHLQGTISYKFLSIGAGATIESDMHHITN